MKGKLLNIERTTFRVTILTVLTFIHLFKITLKSNGFPITLVERITAIFRNNVFLTTAPVTTVSKCNSYKMLPYYGQYSEDLKAELTALIATHYMQLSI